LIEPIRRVGIPRAEPHRLLNQRGRPLGVPSLGIQPSQPSIGTGEIRIERDRRLGSIDRFLDLAAIIEFIAVGEDPGLHLESASIPWINCQRTVHGILRLLCPSMIVSDVQIIDTDEIAGSETG